MTHVIFVENQAQAQWIKQSLPLSSKTKLVAVTAEALQALEAYALPHEAISAYADSRKLSSIEEQLNLDSFALAVEIETFIAQRYTEARFDGPGFLSGQGYWLQYSAAAIASRAFLMREVIRTCSPDVVRVFEGGIDPWFEDMDYARNPWLDLVEQVTMDYGAHFLPITDPPKTDRASTDASAFRLLPVVRRVPGVVRRRLERLLDRIRIDTQKSSLSDPSALAGLRLLMVDPVGYDWGPILDMLKTIRGVECAYLTNTKSTGTFFDAYDPVLRSDWGRTLHELETNGSPDPTEQEAHRLGELFEAWLLERSETPELVVLEMDLFPTLKSHLRVLAQFGPALVRQADTIAVQALDQVRPHVVCFMAIPSLAAKRLAFQCQQQEVPVACFQHGGVYGTHLAAKNEQIEPAHADFFLTYGQGIQARDKPAFTARANYIPVGSARIETMIGKYQFPKFKTNQAISVLWIAEISMRNVIGGMFQVEDTKRYLLQKRCLTILGNAEGLAVAYRPYPGAITWDGTSSWLKRVKPGSVRLSSTIEILEELIRASDLVITDTTSGTVWNEVIALRKPMILYCDPEQTRLLPPFAKELEQACYWCKSEKELVVAIDRLIHEDWSFIEELRQLDTALFRRNYIVHLEDGQCVSRVISFLNEVCRFRKPVNGWENKMLTDRLVSHSIEGHGVR